MVRRRWGVVALVCVGLAVGFGLWRRGETGFEKEAIGDLRTVRIATTADSFIGWSVYAAAEKRFFQENGLAVDIRYQAYGQENLMAVRNGEADLAVSSETPFIRAVLDGADLCAVAVMITARDHLAVVAGKDRGIRKPADLSGKRIGVVPASNGEYLVDLVLTLYGLDQETVQRVGLKPDQMVRALRSGDVDAVAAWNPYKAAAIAALGEEAMVFDAKGVYASYFILSAARDFADRQPRILTRVIRALYAASRFIRDHPVEAGQILNRRVPALNSGRRVDMAAYDVRLQLDQAFLYTLEDQARWMMKQDSGETGRTPNFLDSVCPDALEEVAPDNMRIPR